MVYGPPDSPQILGIDDLKDGEQTSVTCTANNGYPAPLIHWYIGSNNLTENSTPLTPRNKDGRFNATSTLTFTPSRNDHGKRLVCQIVQPTAPSLKSQNDTKLLNVLYSPIANIQRLPGNGKRIQIDFECTSDANPPATRFFWFHNETKIGNGSRTTIYTGRPNPDGTAATSILVIHNPQPNDAGRYECNVTSDLGNASASLSYPSIPDSPSHFTVNQNKTNFSTLSVSWQRGIAGGLSQTFSLEYCFNDTQGKEDGCGVLRNLTGTTYNLTGLHPFTWYWLSLWAVNTAGNSNAVHANASTARINISWNRKSRVLSFSGWNQSFEGLCLLLQNPSQGESCPSKTSTTELECVEPGTNKTTFDSTGDPVVVTFGRRLCSKAANLSVVDGYPPPSKQWQPFMTIALGVTASAGVFLLTSAGLMHFYGLLCCMKRKKDNGGHTQPEGRMVDDDGLVYISVAHDRQHPPDAPPIQTEDATLYASLDNDAMERRKGETKYSDTMATTADGQLMYGNYLVKKRKEEQARMTLPVQADDVSPYANCRDDIQGGDMKSGGLGPVAADGQPMYGNYLVKMRKQQKAKEIAGTPDVFEMYGI